MPASHPIQISVNGILLRFAEHSRCAINIDIIPVTHHNLERLRLKNMRPDILLSFTHPGAYGVLFSRMCIYQIQEKPHQSNDVQINHKFLNRKLYYDNYEDA